MDQLVKMERLRLKFSLESELHSTSLKSLGLQNPINTRLITAYRTLTLGEAVHEVQQYLSDQTGTEEERASHHELLHQAVIGEPKAQEKIKSMISQWMHEQRIKLSQGISVK